VSDNNQAVVAFLGNITAIEGADKIVKADVILNGIKLTQIVVAVGTQENTKIVYFDSNLCLSDDLVTRYPDLKTYLAKGNRVRTIKLRGVISNGLAVNVDHFSVYDNPSTFTEGYSFTQLNGVDLNFSLKASLHSIFLLSVTSIAQPTSSPSGNTVIFVPQR